MRQFSGKSKTERINATGHKNITAKHKTTLEITKDSHLSLQGDCIIAVNSDKCFSDFTDDFIEKLKNKDSRLEVTIKCNNFEDTLVARGHDSLILEHPTELVVRKSDFICNRTLAIKSNKAALDLNRQLVEELKKTGKVEIELKVY